MSALALVLVAFTACVEPEDDSASDAGATTHAGDTTQTGGTTGGTANNPGSGGTAQGSAGCVSDTCSGDKIRICNSSTGAFADAVDCPSGGACVEGHCCPVYDNATASVELGACIYSCEAGFTNQGTSYTPECTLSTACTHDYCSGDRLRVCDSATGQLAEATDCESGAACQDGICCPSYQDAKTVVLGGACAYACEEGFSNQGTATSPDCVLDGACTRDYCSGDQIRICNSSSGTLAAPADCAGGGSCLSGVCCPSYPYSTARVEDGRCSYECYSGFTNAGSDASPNCQVPSSGGGGSQDPGSGTGTSNDAGAGSGSGGAVDAGSGSGKTCESDSDCASGYECGSSWEYHWGLCCLSFPGAAAKRVGDHCEYECVTGSYNRGQVDYPICPCSHDLCAGEAQIQICDSEDRTLGDPVDCPAGEVCTDKRHDVYNGYETGFDDGEFDGGVSMVNTPGRCCPPKDNAVAQNDGHGCVYECEDGFENAGTVTDPQCVSIYDCGDGYYDVGPIGTPRCVSREDLTFKFEWTPSSVDYYGSNDLYLVLGAGEFSVDCDSDGVSEFNSSPGQMWTTFYCSDSSHAVTVTGYIHSIQLARVAGVRVLEWGDNPWHSMARMFSSIRDVEFAEDCGVPNLTRIRSFVKAFRNSGFNGDLSGWNMSAVESMSAMFAGSKFNQPIGDWDVSSVRDMSDMFARTSTASDGFNQPIGDWDVSHVTNMSGMFSGADAFNQPIGGWDVGSVVDMSTMFYGADGFNQPIGDWDVSHVTNMSGMFGSSVSFNQPIGGWDVSQVENMGGMFVHSTSFDQPIGDWDVSHVTDMSWMFSGSSFNQPIGGWNVGHVVNMREMFSNTTSFNQPLADWDVESVVDMGLMFEASSFDQDISGWNVNNVEDWWGFSLSAPLTTEHTPPKFR